MRSALELLPVYVFFALATLVFHASHLGTPMIGDEGLFYMTMVRKLAETHFELAGARYLFDIYHMPGYHGLLALLTMTVGWKLRLVRLVAIATSALLPTSVYALARERAGRALSAAAALGLALTAIYLLNSPQLYPDLLSAAFQLLAARAVWRERWRTAGLLYLGALVTNAVSLGWAPAFVFLVAPRSQPRSRARHLAAFFLPGALACAVWFLVFVSINHGFGNLADPEDLALLWGWDALAYRLFLLWPYELFLAPAHALATFWVGVALGWRALRSSKMRLDPDELFILVFFACQLAFLACFGHINMRYGAASVALLFVLAAWAIEKLPRSPALSSALGVSAAGLVALSLASWFSWDRSADRFWDNALYFDTIEALQRFGREIEARQGPVFIHATQPWVAAFDSPELGVVSRPLPTRHLRAEKFDWSAPLPPGSLLVFPAFDDPPRTLFRRGIINEIRSRLVGPCEAWPAGRIRLFACAMN